MLGLRAQGNSLLIRPGRLVYTQTFDVVQQLMNEDRVAADHDSLPKHPHNIQLPNLAFPFRQDAMVPASNGEPDVRCPLLVLVRRFKAVVLVIGSICYCMCC